MASNVLGPIAHAAGYALLRKGLSLTQSRRTRAFVEGAKRPRDAQLSLLRRILTENVDTEFGKRHGFSRVDGAAAYRQAVPLQTYEDLRPLIEQQELTGEQCLTMEQPVYYHRTSGDGGGAEEHTGHGVRPETDEARPADGGLRLVPRLSDPRRKSVRNQRPSHRRQDGGRHAVRLRVGAAL